MCIWLSIRTDIGFQKSLRDVYRTREPVFGYGEGCLGMEAAWNICLVWLRSTWWRWWLISILRINPRIWDMKLIACTGNLGSVWLTELWIKRFNVHGNVSYKAKQRQVEDILRDLEFEVTRAEPRSSTINDKHLGSISLRPCRNPIWSIIARGSRRTGRCLSTHSSRWCYHQPTEHLPFVTYCRRPDAHRRSHLWTWYMGSAVLFGFFQTLWLWSP